MKKDKNKVLVLLDLKTNTDEIIRYTGKLAQFINADFEFFSVKKPTEVVNTDSQLSALRAINRDCVETNNEIRNIVNSLSDSLGNNVKVSFAIGNVKTEIENRVNDVKPNIVILGKRKPKIFNFIGDSITEVVSKNQDIKVLLASEKDKSDILELLSSSNISHKHKELVM